MNKVFSYHPTPAYTTHTVNITVIISFISYNLPCQVSRASLYPDCTPESEADFCIHCYT